MKKRIAVPKVMPARNFARPSNNSNNRKVLPEYLDLPRREEAPCLPAHIAAVARTLEVPIKIEGIWCAALVDTGASKTFIKLQNFGGLGPVRIEAAALPIRYADGRPCEATRPPPVQAWEPDWGVAGLDFSVPFLPSATTLCDIRFGDALSPGQKLALLKILLPTRFRLDGLLSRSIILR